MKRILTALIALYSAFAFSATLVPIQLLNPTGSTSGQTIISTGPSSAPGWSTMVVANVTGAAALTGATFTGPISAPGITTTANFLGSGTGYTIGNTTGLSSGGAIQIFDSTHGNNVSVLIGGSQVANFTSTGINNAAVGAATPSTGSFTTLTASSTLTGFPGRLLNVRIFTSTGTYTATTGTNQVIVEVQAPSGGTGGTAATAAGQNAASAGGAGGSYARVLLTSGFSGQTVTIGAVGTAGTAGANAGGAGGTTSFGAIISCPGGAGGGGGSASSTPPVQSGAPAPQTATCTVGSGTVIDLTPGQASGAGDIYGIGSVLFGGAGGSSALGIGGQAIGSTTANPGSGYGAGASGIIALPSAAAAAGTTGKPAIVRVWEFS
jgi:hypothetical protein